MVDKYPITEEILHHPKILQWRKRVESNGNVIQHLAALSIIYRERSGLYAILADCRLLTPEGHVISRCVLIRGNSAVIIPFLTCKDNGIIYTLVVEQRRIIDGSLTEEFPGGSSIELKDIRATACEELLGELGLEVEPEELILLTKEPVKINPDVLDDLVHFFYFKRTVTSEFLKQIDGRQSGCEQENEHLRIRVREMAEVNKSMTSAVIIGTRLLEREFKCIF